MAAFSLQTLFMHKLINALAQYGYVVDVLPAYNLLSNHLTTQLLHFEGLFDPELDDQELNAAEGGRQRSQLEINTMNAQYKLRKYRKLLTSPVYAAAQVLLPWVKWHYLEGTSSEAELATHKSAVLTFYNTHYKDSLPKVSVVAPGPVVPPPSFQTSNASDVSNVRTL
jgi:hypothetical protein